MSMLVGARSTRSCEINVTPLIDVLLVLLIIFMVILPEHKMGEKTLIPQPNVENPEKNPEAPIVIQLRDVGGSKQPGLEINHEAVTWDGLEARLKAVYKSREDRVAFVKGDPDVEFEYVAEAVDITHRAGADRIGLMGEKRLSNLPVRAGLLPWDERQTLSKERLFRPATTSNGRLSWSLEALFFVPGGRIIE
jgi:biopolymer transport protein TolR